MHAYLMLTFLDHTGIITSATLAFLLAAREIRGAVLVACTWLACATFLGAIGAG